MTSPDTTDSTPVVDETTAPPTESDTPDDNEAAKYRRRLRDTEKERDTLTERLSALQRSEAERIAATKLADPNDLWRDGAQLSDVLDDAGHVDQTKLDTLIGTVLDAHNHWAKQTHPAAARAGDVTSNGKVNDGDQAEASWSELLKSNTTR